jgi:hypothetical protein
VSVHTRTLFVWIAVGLAGLALAAGVTYAAMQLSSQRIGLSAEPPSAGEELAPPAKRAATPQRTSGRATGRGGAPRRHLERRGARRHRNPDD